MSLLLKKRCCCACFYQVPLCNCEEDPPPCPLYVTCALLEAFFDLHPELDGCLVFELFDGTYYLCFRACEDPGLKVNAIPPDACLLEEIPPEETWFPSCNTCCASECCVPCHTGEGNDPVCCYKLGDLGTFTLTASGFTVTSFCCVDGVTSSWGCPAFSYEAEYELIACGGPAFWSRISGDTCLPPWILYHCNEFGGWEFPGHSCQVVDPCGLPFPAPPAPCFGSFPSTYCQICFNPGGSCCLLPPGGGAGPSIGVPGPANPCDGLPVPDTCVTDCSQLCTIVGLPYPSFARLKCGPGPYHTPICPLQPTCKCQVLSFKFQPQQGCHPENEPVKCLP